jgi:hypothetical protein
MRRNYSLLLTPSSYVKYLEGTPHGSGSFVEVFGMGLKQKIKMKLGLEHDKNVKQEEQVA